MMRKAITTACKEHLRLVAGLANFLVDTVTATVHGAVLTSHDRLDGALVLDCNNLEPPGPN